MLLTNFSALSAGVVDLRGKVLEAGGAIEVASVRRFPMSDRGSANRL